MNVIIAKLPQMLAGTGLTVLLLLCSLVLGLMISITLTFCLERRLNRCLSVLIQCYLFVFRGTPLLVQIFVIYYGSESVGLIHHSFLWSAFKQPFFCAVLALSLNNAAYTTALFSGAIRSIPAGEIQAAQACALGNFALYRHIILPRLYHIVLPPYSNEVIMMLKGTSLAGAIALSELTGVTQNLMGETYMTFPFLITAGIAYLLLNAAVMRIFRYAESRLRWRHSCDFAGNQNAMPIPLR